MTSPINPTRPRVLIVGGGFAGVACARRLERVLKAGEADIVLGRSARATPSTALTTATSPDSNSASQHDSWD
ncbi:hypothetical protein [Streptomyces sp. NPDC002205]|uniref:hypothetical protein n=1 Tax=Streptomyces sp. NPDC002205 TaxID=3154411 RepID=UPI0033214FD2